MRPASPPPPPPPPARPDLAIYQAKCKLSEVNMANGRVGRRKLWVLGAVCRISRAAAARGLMPHGI